VKRIENFRAKVGGMKRICVGNVRCCWTMGGFGWGWWVSGFCE